MEANIMKVSKLNLVVLFLVLFIPGCGNKEVDLYTSKTMGEIKEQAELQVLKRKVANFLNKEDLEALEAIQVFKDLERERSKVPEVLWLKNFVGFMNMIPYEKLGTSEAAMHEVICEAMRRDVEEIKRAANGFADPELTSRAIASGSMYGLEFVLERQYPDLNRSEALKKLKAASGSSILLLLDRPDDRYEVFWEDFWEDTDDDAPRLQKVRRMVQTIAKNKKFFDSNWKRVGVESELQLKAYADQVAYVEYYANMVAATRWLSSRSDSYLARQEVLAGVSTEKVTWEQIGFRDSTEFEAYMSH
jgi:hypothetical protein